MSSDLEFLGGHRLTVYSSRGCPDCVRLRSWMKRTNVPHDEVFIDDDPGAADKLENETGKQAVPFILVDDTRWVRGYHREERAQFSEALLLAELRAAIAT